MNVKRDTKPPRTEPDPIRPDLFPRLHEPGSLKVGDSVWYNDQRYYLERVPPAWEQGTFVRIADCVIRPDQPAPLDRTSFNVPADLVSLAPVSRNKYGRQPTKKAVDRREKMRVEGVRDNGDEVAVLLRACTTLDDVFTLAASKLGETEDELRAKYEHLDNGRKRMTLGNRLRGYFKKGGK